MKDGDRLLPDLHPCLHPWHPRLTDREEETSRLKCSQGPDPTSDTGQTKAGVLDELEREGWSNLVEIGGQEEPEEEGRELVGSPAPSCWLGQ